MAQEEGIDFNFEDKDRIVLRLNDTEKTEIDKAVERYSGLYRSRSHFIRCAINRELRRLESDKPEMETE